MSGGRAVTHSSVDCCCTCVDVAVSGGCLPQQVTATAQSCHVSVPCVLARHFTAFDAVTFAEFLLFICKKCIFFSTEIV